MPLDGGLAPGGNGPINEADGGNADGQ
jgi:hypothetical protein